jgi:preprotein translocase subunit SecF
MESKLIGGLRLAMFSSSGYRASNQALELTSARSVSTSMTTSFAPHLMLALGGRSSALSR